MEIKQYGFITPKYDEKDYVTFGATKIPEEILQPDGNWLAFVPLEEQQKINIETYNCTGFGTTNTLEILHKRKFGTEINLSDRALGILANTWPPGNDPRTVAETLRKQGDVYESSLSFTPDINTLEKYYSPRPLTLDLLAECQRFLDTYDFGYEWVFRGEADHEKLKQALKFSPLGVSVVAWRQEDDGLYFKDKGEQDTHWVTLIQFDEIKNAWLIFDSYPPYLKYLRTDYDFGYALRYWLAKKTKNEEIKNEKKTILERWKIFWYKLFLYMWPDLGVARQPEWRQLRNKFFRSNPYCALCFNKGRQVHHIKPVWKYPEEELNWDNLITLCKHCHLEFAHLGSYKSYDLEIKKESEHWQLKRQNRP